MNVRQVGRQGTEILAPASGGFGGVDIQISTAHAYPRDVTLCVERAIDYATRNEVVAQSCSYTLKRGGKPIVGPSVRLAEIMVQCWTNFRAKGEIEPVQNGHAVATALAWDLESNTAIEVTTKRRITMSGQDAEQVTGAAALAIAFRNAVFRVIPTSIVDEVYQAAVQVATHGEGAEGIAERVRNALEWVASKGITIERVLWLCEKEKPGDLGPSDLELLNGIRTAYTQGEALEGFFPTAAPGHAEPEQSGVSEVKGARKKGRSE